MAKRVKSANLRASSKQVRVPNPSGRGGFRPGQSGNPSGRAKLTPEMIELRELARQHTRAAVEAIIQIVQDGEAPASARVTAASEILDRGWGRATQSVEHAGPGGAAIPHSMVIEFVRPSR